MTKTKQKDINLVPRELPIGPIEWAQLLPTFKCIFSIIKVQMNKAKHFESCLENRKPKNIAEGGGASH